MARRKNQSSVSIQKVLLDMREYRMGLIQTPDQLRFSYMAVIEGVKLIPTVSSAARLESQALKTLLERKQEDWTSGVYILLYLDMLLKLSAQLYFLLRRRKVPVVRPG